MASEEQRRQRQENIAAILRELRQHPRQTRKELCERLSISWGCVSELAGALLKDRILTEKKEDERAQGRTPGLLSWDPSVRFLGLDINRMGVCLCLVDGMGEILEEQKYPDAAATPADLLSFATLAARRMLDGAGARALGIGVAMQGVMEKDGKYRISFGKETLTVDVASHFRTELGLPVIAEHDPNCMLYAFLTPSEEDNILMLRLDRGIGMGICQNRRLLCNGAYEIAKLTVPCEGRRRMLQDVAGIDAIEAAGGKSIAELAEAAKASPTVEALFSRAGEALGVALGSTVNLISVSKIVLCGEMMRYEQLFLPALCAALQETAMPNALPSVSVSPIKDAARGAARLALSEYPFYCGKR